MVGALVRSRPGPDRGGPAAVTELKRAQFVQVALFDISEAANKAEDVLALCRRAHQIIGSLLPASNFFVALYDESLDELSFPYFVDEHDLQPAPRKPRTPAPSARRSSAADRRCC